MMNHTKYGKLHGPNAVDARRAEIIDRRFKIPVRRLGGLKNGTTVVAVHYRKPDTSKCYKIPGRVVQWQQYFDALREHKNRRI